MQLATGQEALFVACEMEASAIQLYSRAISLMEQLGRRGDPLYDHLVLMRADEQEHLARIRSQCDGEVLCAAADGILFEGGLMGAARAGLLSDVEGMLRFARQTEAASARKYREFAAMAHSDEARDALERIAAEEERHLSDLQAQEI